MNRLLFLTALAAGCVGTGPDRSLQSYLRDYRLPPHSPVVVVDIDDTVYERATERPMPGAAEALQELARDHLIVYLTARPTYAKLPFVTQNRSDSEEFLASNGFPNGPLFTSSLWNFLFEGEGGGKIKSFEQLHEFGVQRVALAVGDRPHDLEAYVDNGFVPVERAVIILIEDEDQPDRDRAELPAEILEHAIHGTGPAWPRIRHAYQTGSLDQAEPRVIAQPPEE